MKNRKPNGWVFTPTGHQTFRFCLYVWALLLPCWQFPAKAADQLLADEAAIAQHIKALGSEKSEVREAAAKALREIIAKYPSGTADLSNKDSGEARWKAKLNQIKPGMTKAEVQKILPAFTDDVVAEIDFGQGTTLSYRLDYHWMVSMQVDHSHKTIANPKINKAEWLVKVPPPTNYSGRWVTWYVNGQKGCEADYEGGKYHGVSRRYYENGKPSYDQQYKHGVADGPDTGWYADGKRMYVGSYRNGKQDGHWIHWDQSGNKQMEAHYIEGVRVGSESYWKEQRVK